jgi:hypothetical protein
MLTFDICIDSISVYININRIDHLKIVYIPRVNHKYTKITNTRKIPCIQWLIHGVHQSWFNPASVFKKSRKESLPFVMNNNLFLGSEHLVVYCCHACWISMIYLQPDKLYWLHTCMDILLCCTLLHSNTSTSNCWNKVSMLCTH